MLRVQHYRGRSPMRHRGYVRRGSPVTWLAPVSVPVRVPWMRYYYVGMRILLSLGEVEAARQANQLWSEGRRPEALWIIQSALLSYNNMPHVRMFLVNTRKAMP